MYQELEKQFEEAVTLITLDSTYKECFDRIAHYGKLLRDKEIHTFYDFKVGLTELVGIFESINPVAATADTYLTNLENYTKEKKRVSKALKTLESFDDVIERIALYRKIRNKFTERRNSCEKIITVFQSILKNWNSEWNMPRD